MNTRITLIVGCEDDHEVFVVGALNTEYLNQMPLEDAEAQIHKLKETWTGEPAAYDWREIDCLILTQAIANAFRTPVVQGEVEPVAEEAGSPLRGAEESG